MSDSISETVLGWHAFAGTCEGVYYDVLWESRPCWFPCGFMAEPDEPTRPAVKANKSYGYGR